MFVLITEKIFIFKNPDNFKFFSFYSFFRKTKFFPSSSFFKAFTNASHKIFLKHLVNYSLSVWWELDFWQAVKSITSSECTYSSVKILEILSHLKVKNSFQCARDSCLTKSNLQSRLFTTACNFAFPHFICDVTPTLYLI